VRQCYVEARRAARHRGQGARRRAALTRCRARGRDYQPGELPPRSPPVSEKDQRVLANHPPALRRL
jgi:hypothetical protein